MKLCAGLPYPHCGKDWLPNGLHFRYEPVLRRRELPNHNIRRDTAVCAIDEIQAKLARLSTRGRQIVIIN